MFPTFFLGLPNPDREEMFGISGQSQGAMSEMQTTKNKKQQRPACHHSGTLRAAQAAAVGEHREPNMGKILEMPRVGKRGQGQHQGQVQRTCLISIHKVPNFPF